MKVLLLKDVYKLGRAGDVKRVAAGYGRNYLIPQGMARLASEGALKQADRIRASAAELRARLNKELTAVFDRLDGLQLNFPMRAGETGKLYGSVTTQMIGEAILETTGIELDRHQIDSEPLKTLGVHAVSARLTVDLIPVLAVVVHHEDLPPESAFVEEIEELDEAVGAFSDLQAELEAEEAEAELDEAEQTQQTEQLSDELMDTEVAGGAEAGDMAESPDESEAGTAAADEAATDDPEDSAETD